MRNSRFLLAAAVLILQFAAPTFAAAQKLSEYEQVLFAAANRERAAQSLPALQWDESLAKAARKHANRMAFYNVLEHQLPSEPDLAARLIEVGARFGSLAENIAVGPNPEIIHAGWMDSPGHRKNILNPTLTAVGIAAVRGTGGLFAVQDFAQRVTPLNIEEQEKRVIALMVARGIRGVVASDEARKTCAMKSGIAGPLTRSVEALRLEVSDLGRLPEEVEKRLQDRSFEKATVGACQASNPPGFVQYRIVILLF